MPCSFAIYPSRRLIFARMREKVSKQNIMDVMGNIQTDPKFNPEYDIIIFIAEHTVPLLTQDDFYEFTEMKILDASAKRAYIVMENDYVFGILRMYEAYRKKEEEDNFYVFHSVEKALQWINTNRSGTDLLTENDIDISENM